MIRNTANVFGNFAFLMLAVLYMPFPPDAAAAQSATNESAPATPDKKSSAPNMSDAEKVALAVSAGPAEITKNATVIDMTSMPGNNCARDRTDGCATPPLVSRCAWTKSGRRGLKPG